MQHSEYEAFMQSLREIEDFAHADYRDALHNASDENVEDPLEVMAAVNRVRVYLNENQEAMML